MNTTSIFKVYYFQIHDVDTEGVRRGYLRVKDTNNRYYDFKCNDRSQLHKLLELKEKFSFTTFPCYVMVANANYHTALIDVDINTQNLPAIGTTNNGEVVCEIIDDGITVGPSIAGMTTMLDTPEAYKNKTLIFDAQIIPYNDTTYSSDDDSKNLQLRASAVGITASEAGGISIGQGPTGLSIGGKNSTLTMNSNSVTSSTQESNHGGGMFTTSLNFLQHYFIGLANAVSLPMTHMPNIVKMGAIGVFIKNFIGSKKKKTGIYGLVSEVKTIAKRK